MVDLSTFSGGNLLKSASSMGGSLVGGGLIFLGVLVLIAIIIGASLYVRYYRQFNIYVIIRSSRSTASGIGQEKILFDKGAMIYDKKDKIWYFRLFSHQVDLPVPPYEVLQPSEKGNLLELWQKSQDEFIFLLPSKINKQVVVRTDGKEYPIGQIEMKQVEGDVAYWNQIRKNSHKDMFDVDSTLMKLLPYIVPTLMVILVIFVVWMLTKKFDVLVQVAASLDNAAKLLTSASPSVATGGGNLVPAT